MESVMGTVMRGVLAEGGTKRDFCLGHVDLSSAQGRRR